MRAIRLAIESVDRRLEQAAATLSANPLRVFFTVTLPLSWPGIVAGTVLAFAKALGGFGATITFVSSIPGQTRTLSSEIYGLMQAPGGESGIWRLAVVAVVISLAALLASGGWCDASDAGAGLMLDIDIRLRRGRFERRAHRRGRACSALAGPSGAGKTRC